MSETPERIWAFAPDIFDNLSVWQDAPSPAGDTIEYVRADRIEELEAKLAKITGIGNKMAQSIEGNYYLPGVAGEWRELTGGKHD